MNCSFWNYCHSGHISSESIHSESFGIFTIFSLKLSGVSETVIVLKSNDKKR